ncbi:putative transcriptional regulatory protein [Beauveria bassiana]|nr:putative transcriptional regulatory protein [Beauveria bassiana]KAH8711361.1 Aspercryptin biosynthesis cluster-specific transcription regulator atnN [Beauveria bassiana]
MAPAKAAELRHSTPLAPAIRGRDNGREPTSSSSSSSSVSGSVAVIASPPTENEGTSPPRQKRWATKTRTGCITCRIRRVKCDEAKPMCNRCMTSGRMCDGYKSPPQKPSKQTASTASESVPEPRVNGNDSAQSLYLTGSRSRYPGKFSQCEYSAHLVPPDWDLMEAFHYYYRTILPSLMANQLDDTVGVFMPTAGNLGCKTSFITFIFSNRIADAAKKRGTLRSPEDMPHDQYLWTAFHASMSTMLAVINERLSSPDGPTNDSVFVRIVDLLSIDLTLLGSTWKAHLHGYGALYKMRGGYTRLSKRIKSFDYQFQYVFMLHVLTSTTTPAAQMLTIFDDLTPEETHHVFTFTLYTDVPCSSHVFADLIRINRLRALVAGGASVQSFVLPAARQVYKHIAEFSVADWEEPYGVPDKPEARLLCRIFQKAVLLYGLLTLPPLSLAPTTTTTTPTDDNEASSNLPSPEVSGSEADIDDGEALHDGDADPAPTPSIDTLRVEILSLIREVLPLIAERPTSLAWPLAVVGVTLTGQGDVAERDFVTQTLRRISTHRDAYYGPTLCLGKLHKFWASGKTGWEDCYDEACSVMA